jgi:predicted PurR-regulated permease PerM
MGSAQVHDHRAGFALVLAFVLGQIVDNVVVPRVMGNLVGLNPLWLLFTVFLGAKVAGIPGILVSIPIASTVSAIADDWITAQEQATVPRREPAPPSLPFAGTDQLLLRR